MVQHPLVRLVVGVVNHPASLSGRLQTEVWSGRDRHRGFCAPYFGVCLLVESGDSLQGDFEWPPARRLLVPCGE